MIFLIKTHKCKTHFSIDDMWQRLKMTFNLWKTTSHAQYFGNIRNKGSYRYRKQRYFAQNI